MGIERRAALELRAEGKSAARRLVGYAAKFDSRSGDLGGFTEIIRRGAFAESLQGNAADPLALVHHRPELVLGRRSAGTLRLSEDAVGLAFEIDLPDTQTGRDLLVSVERGDIRGASFAFSVRNGGDRWEVRDGKTTRELTSVDLHEITVTATPAYPDTEVARRALASIAPLPRLRSLRRFMETV